ncbi:hypothetical protein AJ80_01770 [Polytolypa hystricis UAMH7299]|uniref:MYND-type domain-containing protein n=1 Tax=Polytolypa hystricis (strain UAMH7299) TaxID=1447883 RepID=A0A2B7Z0V6_POLH7|nr:hypothetical protein AJ80_01770 [Polytolypa hystricis UAMH7299]
MEANPVIPFACANWSSRGTCCKNEGKLSCGSCSLVVYCGKDCQKIHWPIHKTTCRSPLSKAGWRPAWDHEGRQPAWSKNAVSGQHNPFGGTKYLWGNTPAIDVLKLELNEGNSYEEDIAVLFAASGDLRNVIKTIADLPNDAKQRFEMAINDREFEIVARNAILLLFVLNAPDVTNFSSDAESLIHLWYSSFLPANVLSQLHTRVKPLISTVCSQIADKASGTVLRKTWHFRSGRTLRLVLRKEEWFKLEKICDVEEGLSCEQAAKTRAAITLAPERADYRDRWLFKDATSSMRIAKQLFREDGLLLPFGHPRIGFNTPNPTLFQASSSWSLDDKADPLAGWPIWQVHCTSVLAREDLYGKLFVYLCEVLERFQQRLVTTRVDFEIYNVDVKELPKLLERGKYSRIEVANICDAGYVGIRGTLATLCPLLQSSLRNPHATLITVFINAVMEMARGNDKDSIPNTDLLMEYLPTPDVRKLMWPQNADVLRLWDARTLVFSADEYFERYMMLQKFGQISTDLRVAAKEVNTIIDRWPMGLTLRPEQKGAKEEFNMLLSSNFSGAERYVEWKRNE